jgi:precorrin-6A synthase
MRKIYVVGIGAGHPDYLTVQAINALRQLDVVFAVDKGPDKDELLGLRRLLCDRHLRDKSYRMVELRDPVRDERIVDYRTRVELWHEQRAELYAGAFTRELSDRQCGGILVWGDPSLYDSTLRMLERMQARGRVHFDYEVIPGITSVSALAASHRIALHRIAGSLLITTGRKLSEHGMPQDVDDVVVMLDGECAFQKIPADQLDIYWGAYLGTPDELLVAGSLSEQRETIARVRSEARAKHGWIMDIYLLRKQAGTTMAGSRPLTHRAPGE